MLFQALPGKAPFTLCAKGRRLRCGDDKAIKVNTYTPICAAPGSQAHIALGVSVIGDARQQPSVRIELEDIVLADGHDAIHLLSSLDR